MKENDFLTIKEFAARTGISESTLRHYDDIKLFQPIKRGENGYRYYSPAQTIMVKLINVLTNLDIPLKTISEMQKTKTPKRMLELFHNQELELNRELFRLQQAYAVLHAYHELIQQGLMVDELSISVKWMSAMTIEMGSVNSFDSGYFYDSFYDFLKLMEERKISNAYPVGGCYDNVDAFLNQPGQPTRFFSIAPAGRDVKEAGEYLVGYTRGYYGRLGDFPQRMKAYAEEHNLSFVDPVYEIYLHDEISVLDLDQFLVQISIPLKKR